MQARRRRTRPSLPSSPSGASLPGASLLAPAVVDYAHNWLAGTTLRRLDDRELRRAATADVLRRMAGQPDEPVEPWEDDPLSPADLRRGLRAWLRREGRVPRRPALPAGPLGDNLALVAGVLDLDDEERAVLQLVVTLHASPPLKELAGVFGALTLPEAADLVAVATTLPAARVLRALEPTGRLLQSGLVSVDQSDAYVLPDKIELKRGFLDTLVLPGLDQRGLVARFLPEAAPTGLDWSDFAHVEAEARLARRVLAAALRAERAGVNVLLHGPTGTGKTALASLLARDVRARLYVAGRADEAGESTRGRERLSSLLLGQRLVPRGRALLLFDELEDILAGPLGLLFARVGLDGVSKQWFNHLLETNPVPTIWITNDVTGVDDAFLRRFAYAMELPALGPRQRARVLQRHLGASSRLSAADVEAVAGHFSVSPAALSGAVATARLLAKDGRPDRETLERLLAPGEKLLTGSDPLRRPRFDAAAYRVECVSSPDDLAGIADRLAGWRPGPGPGVALCLHGPPGTGKTEYARYLAHRMGRPLLAMRASDLLGPYVGETEQRLAEAFRRAEADDALLLLDEADTFLHDRARAVRSWEVSQVNEILQQLETFRGVVACTTNRLEALDPAALRRFAFKVAFGWLAAPQAMSLFRVAFADLLAAPLSVAAEARVGAALARLDRLAPGDYRAVSRRWRTLGTRASAAELVAALEAEVLAKPGAAARTMGF